MQKISVDRSGEGTDQMEMLLQAVKHRLDLRPPVEEDALPLHHDLPLLLRMRLRKDNGAELFVDILPHHDAAVVDISHGELRCVIDEFGKHLSVVLGGRREVERTDLAVEAHGCMQLEPVVRSLVIVSEGCNAFGYPMRRCTMQFADFKHGGIHDADRSIAAEFFEEIPHLRQHSMTVCDEILV